MNSGGFDAMAAYGTELPSFNQDFNFGQLPQGASSFAMPNSLFSGGVGGVAPDRGLFSSFLQQKYADGTTGGGYGSAGLGILQGLGGAYMGMKQYGLAKNSLEESKKQFNLNYGAQQKMTNASLEDRQRRRVLENPNAMGVDDYMKKNGI